MIKHLPFFLILLQTYYLLSDGQYMYYPQPDTGYYFEDFDYQENLQKQDMDVASPGPKWKASDILSPDEYPFKGVPVQTQIPAPVLPVPNTSERGEYDYIYDSKEYEPRGIYYNRDQNYDIICKTQKRQNSHVTTRNTMDLDATNYKVIPRGDSFIVIDPNEYLLCSPTSPPDVVSTNPSMVLPGRLSTRDYFGKRTDPPSYTNIYPFQRQLTRSVMQTTKSSIQFKRFNSFEGSSKRLINHSVRTVSPFFRMDDVTRKERLVTQSILNPTRTHSDSFAGSSTQLPTNTVRSFFQIQNLTPKHRAVTRVHPFKLSQESLGVTRTHNPFTPERRTEYFSVEDQLSLRDTTTDNQEQMGKDHTNAFIDSSIKKMSNFHKFQHHKTKSPKTISSINAGKITPLYKYVSPTNHFSPVMNINQSPTNTYKSSTLNPAIHNTHDKIINPTTKLTISSITKKNINKNDIPRTNVLTPKQETWDKVTKYLLQTSSAPHTVLKTPKDDLNNLSKPELQFTTKSPFDLAIKEIDSENLSSQGSNVSTVTKPIFLHDEQSTSKSMFGRRHNLQNFTEPSSTVFPKKVNEPLRSFTPIRIKAIQTKRNSPKTENQTSGLSSTTFPYITKELKTKLPSFLSTSDHNSSVIKFPSTKTLIASTRIQHSNATIVEKYHYDKVNSHSFTTPILNSSSTYKPRTDVISFDNEMLQSKESTQPHAFTYSSSLTTNDNKEKEMTQPSTTTENFEKSINTVKFNKYFPFTLSSEPHKKFSFRGMKFRKYEKEYRYSTTNPSSERYDPKTFSLNGVQFTKRVEEDWYPTTYPSLLSYDHKRHTFGGIQFRRLNDDEDDEEDDNLDPITKKEVNSVDLFHVKSINTTPSNVENQTISIGDQDKQNPSTEHLLRISEATQQLNQLPSSLTTSSKFLDAKPIPPPPIDSKFKTSEREIGKNFPLRDSKPSSDHTGKTNLKTEGVNGTGEAVIVRPPPEPPLTSLQPNFHDVTNQKGFSQTPVDANSEPLLEHKAITNTSWHMEKTENMTSVPAEGKVYSDEFKVIIFKPNTFLELSKAQNDSSASLKPKRQFNSLKVPKSPPILYRRHSQVNLGWRYQMGTQVPISKYLNQNLRLLIMRIKPELPSLSNSSTIRPYDFFKKYSKKRKVIEYFGYTKPNN